AFWQYRWSCSGLLSSSTFSRVIAVSPSAGGIIIKLRNLTTCFYGLPRDERHGNNSLREPDGRPSSGPGLPPDFTRQPGIPEARLKRESEGPTHPRPRAERRVSLRLPARPPSVRL